MIRSGRKIVAVTLAGALLAPSAMPLRAFAGLPEARPIFRPTIQCEAIVPILIWLPVVGDKLRATYYRQAGQLAHPPQSTGTDHFLADTIRETLADDQLARQLTTLSAPGIGERMAIWLKLRPPRSTPESALKAMKEMALRQFDFVRGLRERMEGPGASLYTLSETGENQFFRGQDVDYGTLSFPLLQAKQLGNEETADRLKDGLWRELRAKGKSDAMPFDTAVSGSRLIILGIPADRFEATLVPIVQDFIEKTIVEEHASDDYARQLRGLPFYLSHTRAYTKSVRSTESSEFEDVTPLEEMEISQREFENLDRDGQKDYVNRLDDALRLRRHQLAQLANYYRSRIGADPGARGTASRYWEQLQVDALHRLFERLEVIEKASPELQAVIRQASLETHPGVRLPILDDATIKRIKEILSFPSDNRTLLYEALYQGRKKIVPVMNYDTDRLPRLLHLLPYNELTELQQQLNICPAHPTSQDLLPVQQAAQAYHVRLVEALVYAYRSPRFVQAYRLDLIQEVAIAETEGLLARLGEHLDELAARPGAQAHVASRMRQAARLFDSRIIMFRRDVGDETMLVIYTGLGFKVLSLIELNKFNAYQLTYAPTSRDEVIHRLLERLLDIHQELGPDKAIQANQWWQAEIPLIGQGAFQYSEKLSTPHGMERLPVFTIENPLPSEPEKVALQEDRAYMHEGRIWKEVAVNPAWRLTPATTLLGSAVVMTETLLMPDQLVREFIRLSEKVISEQKKDTELFDKVAIYRNGVLIPAPIYPSRPLAQAA